MPTYRENPKHKRGARGDGPPRWFPDRDTLCPQDLTLQMAQQLLDEGVDGRDDSHPGAKARFAVDAQGRFFKAYSHDQGETWHGYPVRDELVPRQVPSRVLRKFRDAGRITQADYNRLVGGAK